jgi:dihydroflavonol-4-reductase
VEELMRALVTGGTGFVGAAVVRALLAEGAQVACLVRAGSDLANLTGLEVTLVEGDLLDRPSLERALRNCDELYHVAAFYSTRPEDASRMFAINAQGSRWLFEAAIAAGVRRIVHTSTIGTIGRPADGRPPTEEDGFVDDAGASPYALSKLQAERAALELASQGAPIVVVNPCAPVGARDIKPSSTGARIIAYLEGRAPSFIAGGINFVAVDDVARGHLLAAQVGRIGERYILGNQGGNLSFEAFCALMQSVSGQAPPRTARVSALGRVRRLLRRNAVRQAADLRPQGLTADASRAVAELGLPQTPLESAFGQAIAWFRAHGYVGKGSVGAGG